MTYDFFAAQRHLRVRTRFLVVGFFVLLWALVNFLGIAMHSRRECSADSTCTTTYHLNVAGLVVSGLVVAAYLALASLVTSRALVGGRAIRPADGPAGTVLRNVVAEVAIASGVPVPAAFIVDDPSLNAFAVSDGRHHGAIAVTSGLLAVVDRRELTGVVAHEMAHIRNRDSRVLLVGVFAVGAVVVAAAVAVGVATAMGRATRHAGKNIGGLFVAMLAIAMIVLAAILRLVAVPAALLLRAALSRQREELADASAVQYTRDPTGLRSALEKIAADASPAARVSALARALCIEQPHLAQRGFLDRMMASHPPIEERIAWLRALEGASGATT